MRVGTRVQLSHFDTVGYCWKAPTGPIGTVVISEEDSEMVTVRWDTGLIEELAAVADNYELVDITPRLYVNVYLHDRAYGGPEEGGWWVDTYAPEQEQCRVAASETEVAELEKAAQAWCDEENGCRRSDVSSVLSEGKFIVELEAFPAAYSPNPWPHYE